MLNPKYIAKYTIAAAGILSMLLSGACGKDDREPEPVTAESRLFLRMAELPDGASVSAEELVAGMKLFAFRKTGPVPFDHEIYALTRTGSTLKALMRTGNWEIVILSPQSGGIYAPGIGQPIVSQRMYQYSPSVVDGLSSSAGEIFYNRIKNLPFVEADGEYAVSTGIARNVAMVKLFFEKAVGIDNASDAHTVKLYGVPSSLNWAGGLYPDKNNPDTLPAPLEGIFSFSDIPGETGFSKSDTVTFIIPAHRGDDFWLPDGITPNPQPADTTTRKMALSVDLTYADGSQFIASNKTIPVVPRCNGITEIRLKINKADVEITAQIKPWEQQDVSGDLSIPFLNVSTTEVSLTPGSPFRIYFWTNQKTSVSIEPEGRIGDPITGTPFLVGDYFADLEYRNDNPNFHLDIDTGSGYFDINNMQTLHGATRCFIYLNSNGIRRAIAVNILP